MTSGRRSSSPVFRRPAALQPQQAEQLLGDPDPALREEAAHATAQAVVGRARLLGDPAVIDRLVHLVETEGLAAIAGFWADAEAVSLPGALWRLYVLREWVRCDPWGTLRRYRSGVDAAPVSEVVAGVGGVPEPQDLVVLADAVLSGFFAGDLAVALERAAAFTRILATGTALEADLADHADRASAARGTAQAARLQGTARDLEAAASRWRDGTLE